MRFVISLFSLLLLISCGKPAPNADIRYVIATSGLNLRAQASPTSPAVKLLRAGSEVTVLEELKEESSWQGLTGRWAHVRFEQTEGWAFGAFLSKERPPRVLGKWSLCEPMVNVGPMEFATNGSCSSVSIGDLHMCRYTEQGDTVTIDGRIWRLTAEDRLCQTVGDGGCWCRN